MTYKHNNKSLVVILMSCPFTRIRAVGFPHGSMTCLAQVLGSDNGDKYRFHLAEHVLNQITKCLITHDIHINISLMGIKPLVNGVSRLNHFPKITMGPTLSPLNIPHILLKINTSWNSYIFDSFLKS